MKTIRELINLIESAQNPVDDDVEHLANVAADAYWSGKFGMTSATEKVKMARDIVQAVEDGRLSIEELRQDIRDLDKPGVTEDLIDHDAAEPLARHFAELYYNGLSSADEAKMAARVYQQVVDGEMSIDQLKQHIAKLEKEKGIKEATNVNNLLSKATKDANKDFKKAKADKLKAAGDYFTKGEHWQGAKPGDYGYTGYQGHGMPTDRAERARIRADKKKQQDK